MLSFAGVAEAYFWLKSRNFEAVMVVLVGVPAIAADEAVKCRDESLLTARISEVESLQVLHEGVWSMHLECRRLSAVVLVASGIELCSSCVSHHFVLGGGSTPLGTAGGSLVVVAFDEEDEVSPSLSQSVIERFVVRQSLHVEDVCPDRTAEDGEDEVDDQTAACDADC